MASFKSLFDIGDHVCIDDDHSIIGIVTGLSFRQKGYITVGISYMHNGSAHEAFVEEFRVTKVPKKHQP